MRRPRAEPPDAEEYAHFGRYLADPEEAAESYKVLTSLGLGDRAASASIPRGG